MSVWNANHSEVLQLTVKLGQFPERRVLENLIGPMPEAPIEIINDMARSGPWSYSAWLKEWGPKSTERIR